MTQIWLNALPVFLLIFCRVTAFFVISPIFTYRSIPTIFKIGLGFFISLIIFMMHGDNQPILTVDLSYTIVVIREVLIGIMLGYIVYLFFALIHVAGGIIDIMIGFSMANVLDPATGISVSITANFKYLLMLVCFLMMNGHHYLITGLMDSFQYIPLDNNWFARMADGSIAQVITEAFVESMLVGLQIALPFMVALFITDVGLGFLAKTAPQFNVFVVGFPIKIFVGLFLLMILLPGMSIIFEKVFAIMFSNLERLFGVVTGS